MLVFIINTSFAQIVTVTGRCYYDVNRNRVFDGGDSALANVYVYANYTGGSYDGLANSAGQYSIVLPLGTYNITTPGLIDDANYDMINENYRTYTTAGSDVVDLAFQPRDSITKISTYIIASNPGNLPPSGGTYSYSLRYGYDGWLPTLPATLTLRYNPMLTLQTASVAPSVSAPGLLQWNIANLPRNLFFSQDLDSIILSFSFPPVGDTISLFSMAPKLISNIPITKKPITEYWRHSSYIEHPVSQPIGATSGVKWLRQYSQYNPLNTSSESGLSIDTTQDGNGYFMLGVRSSYDGMSIFNKYIYIGKLNKDGLSIWEHNLEYLPNHLRFDDATAIKHTSDGGCLVLGLAVDTNSTPGNNYLQTTVVRFDSLGNVQWVKKLQSSGGQTTGKNIVTLPDGSFWIVGSTNSRDGDFTHSIPDTVYSNVFVAKFAANGNLLFTKVYGGSNSEYADRLIPLQNGSLLLLGVTASNDGDVVGAHPHYVVNPHQYYLSNDNGNIDTARTEEAWALNINASGGIIWSRCYGGTVNSYLTGAAENGSGVMLVGSTDSKDGDLPYYPEATVPLWVLQISPTNGNIIWSKLHKLYKGYPDSNYVSHGIENYTNTNLRKTKDGNFVLGSIAEDKYGPVKTKHGFTDLIVTKLNSTGDILWQKAIGGTYYDYTQEIILDKNDDIVFTGSSSSENDDLYLPNANDPESNEFHMIIGKMGITNIIKGQVFVDNNGNHIKEANEPYYNQGQVISVKGSDTMRARIFNGQYLNNADTGTYITSYRPANNYYTVFPTSRTVNFTSFDLKDSADFALTPIPGIKDLEIQLVPLSIPRPGFDVTYRIITKNVGTATVNNAVIGLKHDARMTYNFASRTESGATADSLWWGPFTLNAFDIDTLFVNFTLDPPPLLNNTDTLTNAATANPIAGDATMANNRVTLREQVRGSYDPNDKTEAHGGTLTTTQYAGGEYLQYLIRFQNTGTDTAFFITVKDTLQEKLDLNSLEVLSASHPFTFKLEGFIATWDFKKILLPDSTTDEPNSHGFILFRVKPKAGLTVGDVFSNKAAIYFDYNLPVITNEDKTILGANNGVCPNGNVSYTSGLSGSTYQWQVNTGSGYVNLSNGGIYSDVTTPVLRLTGVSTALRGNRYRCVVNGNQYSPENVLRFAVQWTGNAGTAWENPANWDCGTLPDGKTEVVIPAGTNYPQVGSNAACFSLRLSPGSTVTVKTGFQLTITGRPE